MDIVVRGKNRPVSSRLDAVARREGGPHRQVHPRRRAASRSTSPSSSTARIAESQLCEITVHLKRHFVKAHACGARARGRARPRGRQGRAPGRADQGEAGQPRRTRGAAATGNGNGASTAAPTTTLDGDDERRRRRRRRADRQDEAVRRQADGSRGGRAADGAARPRLLPVHQHRDRARRGALPPQRRRPRADRGRRLIATPRRRRVHARRATTMSSRSNTHAELVVPSEALRAAATSLAEHAPVDDDPLDAGRLGEVLAVDAEVARSATARGTS